MAITKIIAIRDRLDKRVNYAVNGEKTTLDAGITYATNPEKTEQHLYNSAYVEGINNLYEFDVGSLSGWMYSVNGWFPNYGCSRYALQNGDVVEWVYTCDLGYDVGGGYSTGS